MLVVHRPIRVIVKYTLSDILRGLRDLFGYEAKARHLAKRSYVSNLPAQQLYQLYFWLTANCNVEKIDKEDTLVPLRTYKPIENLPKSRTRGIQRSRSGAA